MLVGCCALAACTAAAATPLSARAALLSSEHLVESPSHADGGAVAPVDGRLRGQDFAARITSVSWPDEADLDGRSVEATPGHRFVVFALTVSVNSGAIPTSGTISLTAAVTSGSQSEAIDLSGIDDQIVQAGAGNGWPSGSEGFTLEVPNTTHAVDLVLSEGSFSQSFDLWTLTRTAPAPVVLYRDDTMPTLEATSTTAGTLALSNPADGFTDTAAVSVQSATLGEFPRAVRVLHLWDPIRRC